MNDMFVYAILKRSYPRCCRQCVSRIRRNTSGARRTVGFDLFSSFIRTNLFEEPRALLHWTEDRELDARGLTSYVM